ncbi:hypothetical protein CSC80_16915 [Maribacter sp. 6B07]|uniref:Disease resistance R13L4/SHOC-2-like LRR domain-containing protein n=1 Tax=Maribacter dokdonensis TaxID=320912 RepID=A0A1H4TNE6_9FLAO|nr:MULTISPECIES: hypothetical protein [Maribacter]PHN92624.1 hypothetical protein CSC80_16915 [Maribacter sp. 6B07]SEC58026.1 hypothetical protein SAMN05192540_3528 [Maribacter dokdonensis]
MNSTKIQFIIFIICLNINSLICQENSNLQIEYIECKNNNILEVIQKYKDEVKTISKSNGYIEIREKEKDISHFRERYNLNHPNYNSDSIELNYNYPKANKIKFVNFESSRISYLNLTSIRLIEFPKSIFNFKKIKSLEMTNHNFKILPEGFNNLKKLKTLRLGHTPIKKLPHDFSELNNLETLSINYKTIENKDLLFKTLSNLPKLKNLELWSVSFETKLPKSFLKLKKLKKLRLVGSDFDFSTIYEYHNLKELDLTLSTFKSFDSSIQNLKKLNKISILGSFYIQNLPEELSELKKLKHLEIDFGLGSVGYKYKIDTQHTYLIISSLPRLKKLYLGDYFKYIYPFWLNKRLDYLYYDGHFKTPKEENLKLIKEKITIELRSKCEKLSEINNKIICK